VDIPLDLRFRFVAAGWYPGRAVRVPLWVPTKHPAGDILAAFGGLTLSPGGRVGEECAKSDLSFKDLRPYSADAEVWCRLLGTRLVGVADVDSGHGELYVAEDGRCFGLSCIHDAFYFEGVTLMEAVRRAMHGRRARPLLRPDQPSVDLYGIQFNATSPEVYRYRQPSN
jgi:hypothetical protein